MLRTAWLLLCGAAIVLMACQSLALAETIATGGPG
jgi:hypothetical protein